MLQQDDPERRAAMEWLHGQEKALAEVFLQEGMRELPVDGSYLLWRQAQRRRLGKFRQGWMTMLAEAGWTGLGPGSRSLAYLRPDLLAEYDGEHEENAPGVSVTGRLTDVESVWWRCLRDDSHRWKTSINNRHVAGTGCPRCGKKGVSRREQEIFTALRRRLPALVSPGTAVRRTAPEGSRRRQRSWRVDMLLPGPSPIAVEYDGAYWHRDAAQRDIAKAADLTASGHHVIRIRELPLPTLTPNDIVCTADQPAEEIAETVYETILRLTGLPAGETFAQPGAPDATQLGLFDDTHETASADRSGAGRRPVAVLLTQMVREVHRGDVATDMALSQHLVWRLPLDAALVTLQQQAGGLRALASAVDLLIDQP
ncbi:zinc-ribbon domain-containing protein [Streptomyces sp. BK205]|uniref:zinc-ribbon domain-containing protein n=1 Tax=Streptomyces sp. BK205 TaxID=2512164 RepID=UPI0014043FD4|nr:zinc-ribbon domain-containing protein [Streptomyces sp. BK205]